MNLRSNASQELERLLWDIGAAVALILGDSVIYLCLSTCRCKSRQQVVANIKIYLQDRKLQMAICR